ncbi:MAG: insulinase family protein [Actinobacteria bacterium]|nr:insulinase family protein [Actinomycetota bacterium]
MIEVTTLDCGVQLVAEPMKEVASVSAGFWVGTGSRDEHPLQAGASHFLEHLLFKGTATKSSRWIAESIDAVGGDMNAFTTKEYTAFYVRLLSEHLDLGLDVLCDIMWSPALRPEEMEAERQVILDEILMHEDEPSEVAAEHLAASLFPDHPLGSEVLGERETVGSMTVESLREFFECHYRPENMVVSVAGSVDPAEVALGIERRFAGKPGGRRPLRTPPTQPPRPLTVVTRPTEQAHLAVGMPALTRGDPARWTLSVLEHTLGGGLSSRLFQEVREKRGLAYAIWAERAAFEDAGTLSVSVGTAPGHLSEVLKVVNDEMDKLAADGITERELEVAKGHIRAATLLAVEDSGSRMSRIGASLLLYGEVLTLEDLMARVEEVRLEDVSSLASKVLSGPRSVAAVGPFDESCFSDLVASS